MARSVDEINIGNWTDMDRTVPFPQYTVDIEVKWTADDGTQNEHSATVTFPNVLQNVPLSRLRRYMEEIILRELRIQYGIDEEE